MQKTIVSPRVWAKELRHPETLSDSFLPALLFFVLFFHTSTFQLLDKSRVVTGVVPSPPLFLPSIFLSHIGFSSPTARGIFIECCC